MADIQLSARYRKLPLQKRNIRSGCERTMFELFHDRKSGKKVRVRGQSRIEQNTICRAIGTNFSRIFRYDNEKPQKPALTGISMLIFAIIHLLKTVFLLSKCFRKQKIRKFGGFRNFSYNVPN